jgi:hypothetical protein
MTVVVRVFSGLLALASALPALAANLTIPSTHPRIWYGNAARLAQARSYFMTTPFTPSGGDATELNASRALRGLINNSNADCDLAIAHLSAWRANTQGNFRDAMRQQGDGLLQIYDWCHHRLTSQQITTLVALWNGYMDTENSDDFANQGSEGNNYFWGRVRNNLMWGIASFGENPRAQEFIDNSLDLRLGQWFATWHANFGRGGVFAEGADYGSVMLSYPLLPFASAADFGVDPFESTPFFREAIYSLLYGTTPGDTSITGEFSGGRLLFPFNDDESFRDGGVINNRDYLGDFARFMGQRDPTGVNARSIRAWLTDTGAGRRWMFDALGGSGNVADIATLPLDYYAPGAAVLHSRSAHGANAMQVHLQINTPGGIEHRHLDAGNFQIWRKGRWLVRESVGYAERVAGFAGTGSVDTEHHLAHNGLLFQGRTTARWVGTGPTVIPPGQDRGDQPDGLPRVVRLQHAPQFSYLAVDFSQAYRNSNGRRVDWPYADRAMREFLFIRPLQALVILDRTRGSADSMLPFYFTDSWVERNDPLAVHVTAAQVTRTFLMHFETQPTVTANRVAATIGDQISELVTLVPAAPTFRIINEDSAGNPAAGQFRVELDSVGAVESYFLNVVHGRDTGTQPLTAAVIDNGGSWTLQLSDPVGGTATINLFKGMTSTGGSIAIGGGAPTPLNERVQGIAVTAAGPIWESDDVLMRDGFEGY